MQHRQRPPGIVIARFLTIAVAYYLLLVIVAPRLGAHHVYAILFRRGAEWLFADFGTDGIVRFTPLESAKDDKDTRVHLAKRGLPQSIDIAQSSRRTGYIPTAIVIALVLATPVPWSRRWRALCWGLAAVSSFVALRLATTLLHWFSEPYPFRLYEPGPFWHKTISAVWELMVVAPTCSFVVPPLIWVLVTLRKNDITRIASGSATKPPQPHPQPVHERTEPVPRPQPRRRTTRPPGS